MFMCLLSIPARRIVKIGRPFLRDADLAAETAQPGGWVKPRFS
jgi:hypothetical protein